MTDHADGPNPAHRKNGCSTPLSIAGCYQPDYRCIACGMTFKHHEAGHGCDFVHSEHFGALATTSETFDFCPGCESDQLEDFWPCSSPGCNAEAEDGFDDCAPCTARIAREEHQAFDYRQVLIARHSRWQQACRDRGLDPSNELEHEIRRSMKRNRPNGIDLATPRPWIRKILHALA